jgi:DNA-nicking Smr family endonuclease
VKPLPDVEDLRLWVVVSSTVRPLKPSHPEPPVAPVLAEPAAAAKPRPSKGGHPAPAATKSHPVKAAAPQPPRDVEANLRHRLARGREALAARIDLHGLTHDAARAALTRFVERSAADGWRAVLVITGKGTQGDGVLRRHVPDWLAEPPIRQHIAGVSEAHRRHGGEGALYVALKRT